MAKKSPIQWTTKQKQAAELLQQGARNTDVANQLGIAKSLVTKVSKALKKGCVPSDDSYEAKIVAQKIASYAPVVVNETTTAVQHAPVVEKQTNEVGQETNPTPTNTQEQKPEPMGSPVSEATLARLTVTPVIVSLTPLMCSAKEYLIQRRGWSPNVRWEDIIDTIFAVYFRSIGVVLRGWYEEDEIDTPTKVAPAEEKGNEHAKTPDALKQLADVVTLQIIELAHQR